MSGQYCMLAISYCGGVSDISYYELKLLRN